MLEELLTEIRAGGTLEVNALAERLGATPGLVAAMLEHLQRTGHLRPYQTCDLGCSGCSLKDACRARDQSGGLRLWQG